MTAYELNRLNNLNMYGFILIAGVAATTTHTHTHTVCSYLK